MNRRALGQNVIEYILLVVAVVLIFVAFLHPNGPFKKRMEHTIFDTTVKEIKDASGELKFYK